MKIGIVQTNPEFGKVSRNLTAACDAMMSRRADMWVVPELFATGYQFASPSEVEQLAESIPNGPTTQILTDFARQQRCVVAAGLPERDGAGRFYNAAVLVGPAGLILRYRKIHLFAEEKRWFLPGDEPLAVVDIGEARVGLLICFDHFFPEAARTLALRGAEIIAHPANLVMPVYAQLTMRARALENGVFTVTANRIGCEHRTSERLTFTGCSQIVSPDGALVYSGPADAAETVVVEIDPAQARNKTLNRWNDRFSDRRPTMYDTRLASGGSGPSDAVYRARTEPSIEPGASMNIGGVS